MAVNRSTRPPGDRVTFYVAVDAGATATALGGRLGGLVDVNLGSFNPFPQNMPLTFDNRFGQGAMSPEVVVSLNLTARYRLQR